MSFKKSVSDRIRAGYYKNTKPYGSVLINRNEFEVYHAEEKRLNELLRSDLAEEHDVVGHAKEPLLWTMAWNEGHSSGLQDVESYYNEFVQLMK